MNEKQHIYRSGDHIMTKETFKRIQEEILSLTALSIVNVIFGALSIATGITTVINRYFSMKEAAQFELYSAVYIGIGGILFLIGLWWIINSASIMDFSTDLQIDHYKRRKKVTEEVVISLIVQMVSNYRENKKTIQRMIILSRLGGCFFLLYGIMLMISIVSENTANFVWSDNLFSIIRTVLILCLSAACFLIPFFFSKYASIWDSRIKEVEKAEIALKKQMESY